MSWIDKSENAQFSIETGDGKIYFPNWKGGEKSKEFNTSVFDYINVEKSFVDRKKAKSSVYPLLFWFQGEKNIEISQDFEDSASDSRVWKVNHPLYGTITGQPLNLKRNDSNFNVTEITVDFWETITDQFPKRKVSLVDSIKVKSVDYNKISGQVYASKVIAQPQNEIEVKKSIFDLNLKYTNLLNDFNYTEYQMLLGNVLKSVDEIITAPASLISDVNTLINFPANLLTSIEQRLDLMQEIFNDALTTLGVNPNKNKKSYFEATGGAIISTICEVLTNPAKNDYITRTEIENASFILASIYQNYLATLDAAVVDFKDINSSFIIGYESQVVLNQIVIETVSNLFEIAFESKQERIVQVEKNTNLINLVHKYIGLDLLDENIEKFRSINNIKNKELSVIKKGRIVKYYI